MWPQIAAAPTASYTRLVHSGAFSSIQVHAGMLPNGVEPWLRLDVRVADASRTWNSASATIAGVLRASYAIDGENCSPQDLSCSVDVVAETVLPTEHVGRILAGMWILSAAIVEANVEAVVPFDVMSCATPPRRWPSTAPISVTTSASVTVG
ncbi:hypothetical protein TARUN_9510 [Trichoderma arundinaceum]|uniref:Uncharacterized protein n=1 Tax=Trichoderma arundinaceum TaxID=490622 RepID=A0A395N9E8_TRIAR|nr:hypothetical protein TARUN_9510 [Trichoderma arundinaceum]